MPWTSRIKLSFAGDFLPEEWRLIRRDGIQMFNIHYWDNVLSPGELISSWLLRASFANGLTLAQLIEAIETRFPGISLQRAFIDDELSPRARSAIAKFLRVPEGNVKAQELAQRFRRRRAKRIVLSV